MQLLAAGPAEVSAREYRPMAQSPAQELVPDAKTELPGPYFPASQFSHAADPSAAYFPIAQFAHDVDPDCSSENWPAAQGVHPLRLYGPLEVHAVAANCPE